MNKLVNDTVVCHPYEESSYQCSWIYLIVLRHDSMLFLHKLINKYIPLHFIVCLPDFRFRIKSFLCTTNNKTVNMFLHFRDYHFNKIFLYTINHNIMR